MRRRREGRLHGPRMESLVWKTKAPAEGVVNTLEFSPDGQLLASSSPKKRTIYLWDIGTGKPIQTLRCYFHALEKLEKVFPFSPTSLEGTVPLGRSLAFSPDGRTLMSTYLEGRTQLWDLVTGKEVRSLPGSHAVAYSPDGQLLACSQRIWDATTGEEVCDLCSSELLWLWIVFNPDGQLLAGACLSISHDSLLESSIRLWRLPTGELVRILSDVDNVQSVAFSPDGNLLACNANDRAIKLWEVATGKLLQTITAHTGPLHSVQFSPEGPLLASGSSDAIELWNVNTGQLVSSIRGTGESLSFSPKGKFLASSGGRTIKLWDVHSLMSADSK